MKQIFNVLVVLLICLSTFLKANGQTTEQLIKIQTDSLQRITLKDSLQITDLMVTQIFKIRDSMIIHIREINMNGGNNFLDSELAIKQITQNANEAMWQILGEEKYNHYKEMIRRRSKINH